MRNLLIYFSSPNPEGMEHLDIPMAVQKFDSIDEKSEDQPDSEEILEAESVGMAFWEHPEDCCAPWLWNRLSPLFVGLLDSKIGSIWRRLRQTCYYIVENRYFESFIFVMIIVSSGTLVSLCHITIFYKKKRFFNNICHLLMF